MSLIKIFTDGRCGCDASVTCPLGRTGSQNRCTAAELQAVGAEVEYEGRGLAGDVTLVLTLEEATVVACAIGHHRDRGLAFRLCQEILRKLGVGP